MGETLTFDYYYGIEAEQFSFYRIPRLLVKDKRFKKLSSDAKILYGLMLDRMSLSIKNGWLDDENRAYIIYTVDNIVEDLGCSKPTCTKIMRELDMANGIGLIEKKRRGLGKPDIIYVKNFASVLENTDEEEPSNADVSAEVKNFNFQKQKNLTSRSKESKLPEVKDFNFQKQKNLTSGGKEIELQEAKNFAPNYTNINYTNMNYTQSINQSYNQMDVEPDMIDRIDETENISACIELVKRNVEYDYFVKQKDWNDKELYLELCNMIIDVVSMRRENMQIGGVVCPYEVVRSRFLKLNSMHLQYIIKCMQATTTKISNIKAYLLTALYNAPDTMEHYYQQEVQHDMYGG